MGKRIAVVGTSAVGGYTGAHMARAGEDVTLIDIWPAHVTLRIMNSFTDSEPMHKL
jgi:ketopantoate reductase